MKAHTCLHKKRAHNIIDEKQFIQYTHVHKKTNT